MVHDTPLCNTRHYKVRIKSKWNNPGKGVAPSPTPRGSSYLKGAFWSLPTPVGQLIYIYVYIYIYIYRERERERERERKTDRQWQQQRLGDWSVDICVIPIDLSVFISIYLSIYLFTTSIYLSIKINLFHIYLSIYLSLLVLASKSLHCLSSPPAISSLTPASLRHPTISFHIYSL